jgi:hypothetical protein
LKAAIKKMYFIVCFYKILLCSIICRMFFCMKPNGWGCGKCGRACYVFVPRRKRPSGRNRSEDPVSTHIGYTPCWVLAFFFGIYEKVKKTVVLLSLELISLQILPNSLIDSSILSSSSVTRFSIIDESFWLNFQFHRKSVKSHYCFYFLQFS